MDFCNGSSICSEIIKYYPPTPAPSIIGFSSAEQFPACCLSTFVQKILWPFIDKRQEHVHNLLNQISPLFFSYKKVSQLA